MSHNRPYRLTIAVDTRSAARRSILSGIFRATANSSAWDVAVRQELLPLPAAANATDGIGIRDVARHLGISPRLLFLRFAQLHTRSVLAEINDCRLKAAKQLLRETGKTTVAVAKACGFGSVRAMERCFLSAEGQSPAQYRRNAAARRT